MEKAQDRIEVLNRIEEYERLGLFDKDVENDPPSRVLMPGEIDYTRKKLSSKIKTWWAYCTAKKFLKNIVKNGVLVTEFYGVENLRGLKGGAIITCNHINALDSFIMQQVYMKSKKPKGKLYRVIREGNYTSFPGFFGFLMRNFYTLPLSSNRKTMEKFLDAIKELLRKDKFILIYPEQSMWWNYKKPKPLKKTAFKFAVENNVPILPVFITMEDTDKLGPDGFPIQKYKVNVDKPIFANPELSLPENVQEMRDKNYEVWKNIYEREYGENLEYSTPEEKLPEEVKKILKK